MLFWCSICFILLLSSKLGFSRIGFTLRCFLAMFTRPVITPPKVNRFGWILKHSEYIAGGWPWQILDAISALATTGEPGDFLSGKQHTISPISQAATFYIIWTQQRRSVSRWRLSEQNIENFTRSGRFSRKRKNFWKCLTSCDFRPP